MTNKIYTMLKSNKLNSTQRNYLTNVEDFKTIIKESILHNKNVKIYKKNIENISYSMKYLEYLDTQIKELVLDESIKKIIHKNYIITSMEIINSILYLVFKEKNLDKIAKNSIYDKLKYISENKVSITNLNELYSELDDLRKYRNKVHLTIDDEKINYNEEKTHFNTDWYAFKEEDYIRVKEILKKILLHNNQNKEIEKIVYFLN